MIIARGTDCLGVWNFTIDDAGGDDATESRWRRGLDALAGAIGIAVKAELLVYPLRLELFHGIGTAFPPPATREVAVAEELLGTLWDLVASRAFALGQIEVRADSVVQAPDETRQLRDVFGLECVIAIHSDFLAVFTRADVWLPFTLNAQPQPAVAALNAPRLRAVLGGIEAVVGQPAYAEDTKFARVEGYVLRNHEGHGDILALEDLGYSEAWIAERWPEPR